MAKRIDGEELDRLIEGMVRDDAPVPAIEPWPEVHRLTNEAEAQLVQERWAPSSQQQDIFDWCKHRTANAVDWGGHHAGTMVYPWPLYDRVLIVGALAGTGKTSTMLRGIEEHMPGDVWFGAFAKPIAREISRKLEPIRLARCYGKQTNGGWAGAGGLVEASTVHSLCWQSLLRWCRQVRLNPPMLDERKWEKALDLLIYGPPTKGQKPWERKPLPGRRAEATLVEKEIGGVGVVAWLIDMVMQFGIGLNLCGVSQEAREKFDDVAPWLRIMKHFDVRFKSQKVERDVIKLAQLVIGKDRMLDSITFTEMIYLPLTLQDCPWADGKFGAPEFPQFDWVLGDEAQDLNVIKREVLLRMMKPGIGKLVIVGDKHQAIFGFTGADSQSMKNLALAVGRQTIIENGWEDARVPVQDEEPRLELMPTMLPLSITRRCPKKVVALAKKWAPEFEAADEARDGEIRNMRQGQFWYAAGKSMVAAKGEPPNPDLLAAHAAWEATKHGEKAILCRLNAPLAGIYYKLMLMGIPARIEGRDIGKKLLALAGRFKVGTVQQFVEKLEQWWSREEAKMQKAGRSGEIGMIRDSVDCLMTIAQNVLARYEEDYLAEAKEEGDEAEVPIDLLQEEIERIFSDQADAVEGSGERPNAVTLSSFHKSKGLEWELVVLWGRAETCPVKWAKLDWEKEQEDWLQYVATTRTKNELWEVSI